MPKPDKVVFPSKADFDAKIAFNKMMDLLSLTQKFTVVANRPSAIPLLQTAFSELVKQPKEKTAGQIWREAANPASQLKIAQEEFGKTTWGQILGELTNPFAKYKTVLAAPTDTVVNKGESDFKKYAKFVLGK